MTRQMQRRDFLKGAATLSAATVIGFSSEARAWVPAGKGKFGPFDRVPKLDGRLLTDISSRDAVAQDVGAIIFHQPLAVLEPGSIRDVAKMVQFCRVRKIKVAARGQGHSTHGQSQAKGGLVIDMRNLGTVHEVGDGYAVVDAGSTWKNLLETTLQHGQTPPVLTGYIGLSIGGTLSMGGISGMAYNRGVQAEHVLELTVVTGRGQTVTCSPHRHASLFNAVLAGIGQYAIIVRAKLKLIPAHERAVDLTLRYTDFQAYMADMRELIHRGEFDMVWGGVQRDQNTWFYELYTTSFYTPPDAPDTDHMLRELSFEQGSVLTIDGTYFEYQTRVDGLVDFLRSIGAWDGVMRPWFDMFLPSSQFDSYIENVLPTLAPDDIGNFGFVLIFPLKRSTSTRPLFRLPDDDLVFLFDINNAADFVGFDETFAQRMRDRNRSLFEAARDVGGTRYPIGTLDFDQADWKRHYGAEWLRVRLSKAWYDPENILTPGPGIFPD